MDELHKYISDLMRHGWGESWLPELTFEQAAAINALASRAVASALSRATGEGEGHD